MSEDDLPALAGAVDGARMWRHLEVFDRHDKYPGTPGELESLRHVEADMRDAGFATRVLWHDAYVSLPGAARVVAGGAELPCITQSFSRPSPEGGLTAPAVRLGQGSDADFAGADVRGRIVVVDGIANPLVATRATRAGALGQIHVSPHGQRHEMCVSPVWGSPTPEGVGLLPGTVIVTVSRDDGARLAGLVGERPETPVTLHAAVDTGWRRTPILVAELPGPSGEADEPFVLFSGHHDTWYRGVMDNGGANATMMEVARLAASRRDAWRRGLRVVFWSGHSQGRYSGSSWYAEAHWEELERRAVAHVNVDSTGGRGNTVVSNTRSCAELRGLAREAVRVQGGQDYAGRRMNRAGDQSFWGIGVPSMFGNMSEQPPDDTLDGSASLFGAHKSLAHGTGWWWHTPDDTLDKMDAAILVRDTRIYLHAVWRLLAEPVLPLDYAEHARDLRAELDRLQRAAGDRFDLSPLPERAAALEAACARLAAARPAVGSAAEDEAAVARVNAALMAVSRALVPVDYTTGDRFGQDPAVPQPPWPALQPVRRFADLPAESDDARFLAVAATRARNMVAVALRDAVGAVGRCLAEIGA